MKKEKRIKRKRVMVRITDELYEAFSIYVKKNNTNKSKVIDKFLNELLKDDLKEIVKVD